MVKYVKDNEWGTKFPNFQKWEFQCSHGVGSEIYYSLLEVMQNLRNKYGPITISSGYRCPTCNKAVGGDPDSAHLYGSACDFRVESGYQDNLQNRMKLVTELRNTYNVNWAYCKVDENRIWTGYDYMYRHCNMGTYIHVQTNPGYYPPVIEDLSLKEVTENSVIIMFKNTGEVFDKIEYELYENEENLIKGSYNTTDNFIVLNDLKPDTKYILKVKLKTANIPITLYSETKVLDFSTKAPLKSEKPKESVNIPDNKESGSNIPKNENKSMLKVLLELFIKILKLILGGKYEEDDREDIKK